MKTKSRKFMTIMVVLTTLAVALGACAPKATPMPTKAPTKPPAAPTAVPTEGPPPTRARHPAYRRYQHLGRDKPRPWLGILCPSILVPRWVD